MTYNVNQQAYGVAVGTTPTLGLHFDTRDPNQYDVNYPIGKFWQNTADESLWYLNAFSSSSGYVQATWILIASNVANLEKLQGNSGGPISPNASDIIFVVGDGSTISTIGDPATNTITITATESLATIYTTDDGTATPISGNLNVLGGTGVNTAGASDTITINTDGTIATSYPTNIGTAIPSSHILAVLGSSGIITSGSANVITITPDGSVIGETITGNTGGPLSPVAGNWNILGGTNITTAGSGNTLTINNGIAFSTGSFTPELDFGGATTGITYSDRAGTYTVLGNLVFVAIAIILTSKGSATGVATISGFPFAGSGVIPTYLAFSPSNDSTYSTFFTQLTGGTSGFLVQSGNIAIDSFFQMMDTNFTNTSAFSIQGFYFLP